MKKYFSKIVVADPRVCLGKTKKERCSYTAIRIRKDSGYVLLFLMLIIGSLGLYLSYQMSLTKMNTQSWQLTKTATEFSYWFDIEQNYEQDYSITTPAALNSIQLSTLIQNHYLPYGMARTPTFASNGTPAITSVSEFQCSPLPGITPADGTLSDSDTQNFTCPAQTSGPIVQCTLNQPAYYSCVTNSAISQAQYYVNANYIAFSGNNTITGDNISRAPIGLGLIVRTPGFSNSFIDLGANGSRGLLPNGSYAQSLITMLPLSSFNLYSTDNPQVKGIGIGSYLSIDNSATNPTTPVANNRYSKIIDMGLVQSLDLNTIKTNPTCDPAHNKYIGCPCFGWDNNGNKTKSANGSYDNTGNPPTSGYNSFPPTCIRINMKKYGPGGSEKCDRLDLFYTMYRNYLGSGDGPSRFFSNTDSLITTSTISTTDNPYLDIYLGQTIQDYKMTSPNSYSRNGATVGKNKDPEQYNWQAYFLRCTRNNV